MTGQRHGFSRLGTALNSKSVIILLFVGLWMSCIAAPPKITDFTYRFKQLELIDTVLDAITVTAKFDQEVFHNVTCSDASEQEPAIFSPCCTYNNVSGCVNSGSNKVQCMDYANPSLNNSIVYDQYIYYYTHVQNYATCHSVTIENHASIGLSYLMVSVRGNKATVYNTADFLGLTYGGAALPMCCSEIRRRNPSWTGDLYFGVIGSAPSIVDVRLWNDTKLPIDKFWHQPPVTVSCDGYQFEVQDCLNGVGCFFTPATADPLFDLAKLISAIEGVNIIPMQHSVSIITRQVQYRNLENANVVFPFPVARLQDSSCKYSFPTLVNSAGEVVESVGSPTFKRVECNKDDYVNNVELFRKYVDNLGQTQTVTFADAGVALLKVLPFVVADAWVACNELVKADFLKQSTEQVTVLQTTNCYETFASETYMNDSCCNPDIQLIECCAARDVVATNDKFEIISDNVQASCSAYRCSLNNLGDYMVLSASSADRRSGCATRSTEATNKIFSSRNGLFACIQNFNPQYCDYDIECRASDIRSVCLPSHTCSIPCSKDEDCITGTCTTFPYTNTSTCLTLSTDQLASLNDTSLMNLGLKCMELNLDEIILFFIKQNQGLSVTATREDLITALINNGTNSECQGITPADTEEDCKAVQTCNWLPCDSTTNPYCNQQNCTTPLLGSSNFCATCEAGFCVEVSTFGHCEYTSLNTNPSACASVGGSYNGLSLTQVGISTRCLSPATTQDTCYDPAYCSSGTAACASKCYVFGVTTQTQCNTVGQISGQTPTWSSWTRGSTSYGLCTVNFGSYSSCTAADNRLRFWPGSTWTSALFNTQSFCEAFGRCDTLTGLYNKQTCEALSHCVGNDALTTQESCEAPGSCNDFDGCVFPLRESSLDCELPYFWTPIGCLSYAHDTPALCTAANGTWATRSTTKEECLAKASICFEPPSSGLLSNRPRTGAQTPIDYTFKTPEECTACNGVPGNFYSWRQLYYWAPRQFSNFQWKTREMIPGNYWIRVPSVTYFYAIVQAAVGQRFAKILESEQLCRYAQIQASLQGIVCDCTNSGSLDCYDGFSSSVVALAAFCSGIQDSFSEGLVSLSCASDLRVQDYDCLDIKISVIPISQFESRGVSSISAASISSSRADQRRSALYIKNSAGVAVGQVLSSGSKVETDRSFTGNITVCLTFPSDFTSDLPLQLYDYAVPNDDYTQFVPLGWTDRVKPNGTICFELKNNSLTYFPIGLQDNWENAPFITTYFPAEIFYLFFGAFMYLLVLAFTMFHFIYHIRMREAGRPFFNLSTTALLILTIFLMNRFVYMMLIVSGVMDSNGEVEVVFSSFPALLFYVIYSIIVLRWAEIYHFTIEAGQRGGLTKLKPAIIAMNAFLTLAFALLLILYYTLDDHTPQVINCATPDSELNQMTRGDIVAIIYKAFFAAVSIILSVLFVIYGARSLDGIQSGSGISLLLFTNIDLSVMNLVLKSLKSENIHLQKRQSRVKAFQKLLIVSCVCTLCLLAQAAFLLWSSVSVANADDQQQFYGILSFLYATEIPSSIIFVVMFKKASFFVKAGKHGNLAGSTASTSAPTNSYQPMTSMNSLNSSTA